MKNWKKPFSVLTATALLSGTLFAANVDASSAVKKADIHYRDIKIINNSQSVSIDPKTEPFIYNNTTYIPLRMMGELYNKTVQWSGASNTIIIKDTTPPISQATVNSLKTQLNAKDAKIAELEAEIERLKVENKEVDLDDLEEQLNDDYYDYLAEEFDEDYDDIEIILDGDEDDIEAEVYVSGDDWDDMYDDEKEEVIEVIVEDILDAFKDAEIEGTVYDDDNDDELATFDEDAEFEEEDLLDVLEDDLNDEFEDELDEGLAIEVIDADEDEVELEIQVDGDEWEDDLDEDDKLSLLADIVEYIVDNYDDYEYADIFGDIVDEDDDFLNSFIDDGSSLEIED